MKRKKHRLLAFFIVVATVSAMLVGFRSYENYDMDRVQTGIAQQIIRFHVRANSDSDEDQNLKLLVKNQVVAYMQPLLAESTSIDESRQILTDHIDDIRQLSIDTLRSAGSDYDVNVYFEQSYFPMKSYGDVNFPPGVYEAFRIDIGESEGKNWWCVLYPPLCFVDATYGVLPEDSKDTLKNILTEDEYDAITEDQYVYRFKYLTFLNSIIDKLDKLH